MTLEQLQQQHAPDPRISLWEVKREATVLRGVADAAHRASLTAFAGKTGLKCKVEFITSKSALVSAGRSFLYATSTSSKVVSELVYGQSVHCYDNSDGKTRVAGQHDDYLGWIPTKHLSASLPAPNHYVTVLRAHAFSAPKVSATRVLELCLNARVRVKVEEGDWLELHLGSHAPGYVRKHLLGKEFPSLLAERIISLAKRFLETPYVWGGVTAWGLDCSGLVQTVFAASGVTLPRDADQQETCGNKVRADEIRAADLLFFPGHVAIALDQEKFIHANAHHMRVTVDSVHTDYGRQLMQGLRSVRRIS